MEELRAKITADASHFSDEIKKSINLISNLGKSTESASSQISSSLKRQQDSFKGITNGVDTLSNAFGSSADKADNLMRRLDIINAQIELTKDKTIELRNQIAMYEQTSYGSEKVAKLREELLKTEMQMQKLIESSDKTASEIIKIDESANNFEKLESGLNKASNGMKNLGDESEKTHKKMNPIQKLAGQIVKRFIVMRLAFTAIRAIGKYINETLQQNKAFKDSLDNLKATMNNAFSPIIEKIAPALTVLINMLAKAVSYIGAFLGMIFGTIGKQAKSTTKSIKGVVKAGKEAKRQTAGFDVFHDITEADTSGGGGDGGDSGIEPVGEVIDSEDIGNVWGATEAFAGLREAVRELGDSFEYLLNTIGIKNISTLLGAVLVAGVNILAGAFKILSGVIDIVSGTIQFLIGIFTGDWKKATDGANKTTQGVGKIFEGIFIMLIGKKAVEAVKTFVKEWASNISNWWSNHVSPWFTVEKWQGLWQNVKTSFINGWQAVKDWWNSSALVKWWSDSVAPWFTWGQWQGIFAGLKNNFITGWGNIKTWWNNNALAVWWKDSVSPWFSWGTWSEAWGDLKKGFAQGFKNAINGAAEIINKFIRWINDKLSIKWDGITIAGKEITKAGSIKIGSIPEIPMLAKGGLAYGEVQAVVGDNFNARQNPEVIAPVSDLKGMILEALIQKDISTDDGKNINVTIELDGEKLAEKLIKPSNKVAKNRGFKPVFST